MRLALVWSAFVVLFFSASGSKLPTYVLPTFPILALVLGRYLAEAPPRRLALWTGLAVPFGLALAAVAWLAPAWTRDEWRRAMLESAQAWMVAAALILVAGLAIATWLLARNRRWAAIAVVALANVLMADCLEDAYEEFSPRQSGLELARKMKPLLQPDTRVYSVKIYDQTVPFYIGRAVRLVDYVDEFETGQRAEPRSHIARLEDFPAEWRRPGGALAIMQPGTFEEFQRQGLPMQVLHQDPRRVLVRKP